ncbi:MAG: FAD-dependent oxidoreductase [Polyangiales bacterium]
MRIAVIGGGVAGLGSAWLLEDEHDVTLFEREPRLGGHVRTVDVPLGDRVAAVESGFEFFSRSLWPTFNRLLAALGVELRGYPCRISVYRTGERGCYVLQASHADGRFAPGRLTPRRALDLTQYGLLLASLRPLMQARDTRVTVAQALARVPLTRAFREEFLLPFLLAGWCVEPEDVLEFSAYNVLRYSYMNVTARGAIDMQEVVGGLRAYVAALAAQCRNATLRTGAALASVERSERGFVVREQDGRAHAFDAVVVATNAQDAARLLRDVRGAEAVRHQLERFEYFKTRIAVHGDPSLMPADPRDWSTVNVRHDGRHAQNTVWAARRGLPVFRSWVTYDAREPSNVYDRVEYDHPRPTPRYFEAQRALRGLQGRDGLWLAGVHMHDIDSHESSLLSAVHVAEALSPGAPRLRLLRGEPDRAR